MKFTSNKVINLGSAAFRQWRSTHSHCQYIHGYNLTADITFEAEELDERNWVADFGGLKDLKKTLEYTFDHKLVVAADDPQIDLIKLLDESGVAQVVVLEGGVGCERFAEFVLKTADTFIDEATEGRVRVKSVQINEHDKNFATAHRTEEVTEGFTATFTSADTEPIDITPAFAGANFNGYAQLKDGASADTEPSEIEAFEAGESRINVIGKNGNDGEHYDKEGLQDVHGPIATEAKGQFKGSADQAAPVKPSTKTKGGWFEGTTWG